MVQSREYKLELTGQRYGSWVVSGDKGVGDYGDVWWLCECDCGTKRMVKAGSLRSGRSTSCGCYNISVITKHGMEGTSIYNAWAAMIQRCENPKSRFFADYGGRGISVCPEWRGDFRIFYRDMGDRPAKGYSLGRIDNDGNYEPGNCRWETSKQQMRNRRTTKWLEFNGERRPLGEWAELYGLPAKIVKDRVIAGWRMDEVLLIPHPSDRWVRQRFNAGRA
jgi:hypothetical protein